MPLVGSEIVSVFLILSTISAALFLDQAEPDIPTIQSFHWEYGDYGGTLELKCNASEDLRSNVSWSKNGTKIRESKVVIINEANLTLTLLKIDESISAVYQCKACSSTFDCMIHSHWVYVNQKTQRYELIGSEAELPCLLSRFLQRWNAGHRASWDKFELNLGYGYVVDKEEGIQLVNGSSSVLLDPVSYSDEGAYTCTVYSRFGVYREFYDLFVRSNVREPSPEVTTSRGYRFVLKNPGSMVGFHIKRTNWTTPPITWTKNDVSLNSSEWTYTLDNLSTDDNGVYKAEFQCATEEVNYTSCSFRFWLAVGSVFKKRSMPSLISYKKGNELVQVKCDPIFMDYSGINYRVEWSDPVSMDTFFYKYGEVWPFWNSGGATGDVIYSCTVSTDLFGQFSEVRRVQIAGTGELHPPNFTNKSRTIKLQLSAGDTANFSCQAVGNPSPNITWTKDGEVIGPETDNRVTFIDWEIKVENVTKNDSGEYECRVCNQFGCSGFTHWLLVDNLAEGIQNVAVVDKYPKQTTPRDLFIPTVALSVFFFTILLTLYLRLRRRKPYFVKRVTDTRETETDNDDTTFHIPEPQIELKPLKSRPRHDFEFHIDPEWEIHRPILGEVLGAGHFGVVVKAKHEGIDVAVKQLKEDNHTDQDVLNFYRELEIMKMLGKHPNIIQLLGCCSQDGPLLIVVEYALNGNLRDYLLKHRHQQAPIDDYEQISSTLTLKRLIKFAYQVALGMEHLASIKYVHRDLAARNVLVFKDDVLKISDFGLTRDIRPRDYYRRTTDGLLPAAWMAPESLDDDFYDSRSDVWSYGVLFWEVMTLGAKPYLEWTHLLPQLKLGKRLEQPNLCPDDVFDLMGQCWRYDSLERPTFSKIVQQFTYLNPVV